MARFDYLEPHTLRQAISLLQGHGDQARIVAEPPGFGPPAAIANAIYDAVGVRIKELPLSAERVLAALQGKGSGVIPLNVDSLKRAEGLEV